MIEKARDNSYKMASIGVFSEWKEAYKIDTIMRQCPLPTNIPITILASYRESKFLAKKNSQIKKKLFSDWKKIKRI